MSGRLETAKNHLLGLLFPPRCVFCARVVAIGESCPCESEAEKQRLRGDMAVNFGAAARKTPHLKLIVSSYVYSGAAAEAVKRFKFRSSFEEAGALANIMCGDARDFPLLLESDFVTAVPSYQNRSKHASALAKQVAVGLEKPYEENALRKTRKTEKQHELTQKQREKNLKDCFEVPAFFSVKDKKVLLIDDVITTGATLEEAAKTLAAAGAQWVSALTFCSSRPQRKR